MIKLGGSPNFLTEFGVCSFNAQDPLDPMRLNTHECEVIKELMAFRLLISISEI